VIEVDKLLEVGESHLTEGFHRVFCSNVSREPQRGEICGEENALKKASLYCGTRGVVIGLKVTRRGTGFMFPSP
jgi:hypothetical protein